MSRFPPREETKRIAPSGVHTGLVFRCVASVILTGSPPAARTTQMDDGAILPMFGPARNWRLLSVKATSLSSGDHTGEAAPSPPAVPGTTRGFSPAGPAM